MQNDQTELDREVLATLRIAHTPRSGPSKASAIARRVTQLGPGRDAGFVERGS
jgi:hypothetical protein